MPNFEISEQYCPFKSTARSLVFCALRDNVACRRKAIGTDESCLGPDYDFRQTSKNDTVPVSDEALDAVLKSMGKKRP